MDIDLDKLFEYVVAVLMRVNGYRVGTPGRYLEGRGTKHQIDAIGIYPFAAPFTFPIRLVSEAKCYTPSPGGRIGISAVRNLEAVVTDLEQTLPRARNLTLDEEWKESTSCTYHGAMFSTIPFSQPAVEYANSYGIDLVPLGTASLGGDPVEALGALREAVTMCLAQESPRFRNQQTGAHPPDVLSRLWRAGSYAEVARNAKTLRAFLDLVGFILADCAAEHAPGDPWCGMLPPEVLELARGLQASRIASMDGHTVVVSFSEDDFEALRRHTVRRFYRRGGGDGEEPAVRNPFSLPPDAKMHAHDHADDAVGPYNAVSYRGPEAQTGARRSPQRGGDIITLELELDCTDASGVRRPVHATASISRDLSDDLRFARRPRKLIVAVDVGCFYYGLVA